MKKLLIIVFTFSTLNTFTQNPSLGFYSGLNMANISFVNADVDSKFLLGFLTGINYEYQHNDKYVIDLGIEYKRFGCNVEAHFTNNLGQVIGIIDVKHIFDYISLPVKVGFLYGNKLVFIPKIGVVPAYLARAKVISKNDYYTDEVDIKKDVSKFNLSGILELESNYQLNDQLTLTSGVCFQHSILNVNLNLSKIRNYSLGVFCGLKYKI